MAEAATEIVILSSTAMKIVVDALTRDFEAQTGLRLAPQYGPSGRMARRAEEGEACDVVVSTLDAIEALAAAGRIRQRSATPVARSAIGVAVARGAARPDIATVEGFRAAMLAARRVATSHPTGGAQSGAHLARVFERLDIQEEMRGKTIYGPGGPAGLIGNFLLRGEADIGLQQMPELMAVPGIDIVGPLPAPLQLVTVFAAGIAAATRDANAASAFIARLKSHSAVEAIEAAGMSADPAPLGAGVRP